MAPQRRRAALPGGSDGHGRADRPLPGPSRRHRDGSRRRAAHARPCGLWRDAGWDPGGLLDPGRRRVRHPRRRSRDRRGSRPSPSTAFSVASEPDAGRPTGRDSCSSASTAGPDRLAVAFGPMVGRWWNARCRERPDGLGRRRLRTFLAGRHSDHGVLQRRPESVAPRRCRRRRTGGPARRRDGHDPGPGG